MRTMMIGFSGWARMEKTQNEELKIVDTALTVVGTLLVAVTFALVRG